MEKQIPGYEHYSINEYGDILNTRFNRILSPYLTAQGYRGVQLWKDNKCTNYSVHQLVAICFIPNPENKSLVNHKDSNRQNNYYLNLEWSTNLENIQHGNTQRQGKRMSKKKIIKIYKQQKWDSVEDFLIELIKS